MQLFTNTATRAARKTTPPDGPLAADNDALDDADLAGVMRSASSAAVSVSLAVAELFTRPGRALLGITSTAQLCSARRYPSGGVPRPPMLASAAADQRPAERRPSRPIPSILHRAGTVRGPRGPSHPARPSPRCWGEHRYRRSLRVGTARRWTAKHCRRVRLVRGSSQPGGANPSEPRIVQ